MNPQMPPVPVGTIVHFYNEGKNATAQPAAAIVLESFPGGLCTLNVLGQTIKSQTRQDVWHVGSKQLEEFPHFIAMYGAWDFHPWNQPPSAWGSDNKPNFPQSPAESYRSAQDHVSSDRLESLREIAGSDLQSTLKQEDIRPEHVNSPPAMQAAKTPSKAK